MVRLSAGVQGGGTMDYETHDGTARKETDREHRFFFRAEDGIGAIGVTGVQTCALPILKVEANETLTVSLGNVTPLGAGVPGGTGTITSGAAGTGTIEDRKSVV